MYETLEKIIKNNYDILLKKYDNTNSLLDLLISKIIGHTISMGTFILSSIWLVCGIQMLSLGIVGEYIGKIYNETKARPRYAISENLEEDK